MIQFLIYTHFVSRCIIILMALETIIGFDIGGTRTAAVAVLKNRIIKKSIVNTPKNKAELVSVLKKIAAKFGANKSGKIGIAVAGIIDGTVLKKAPNIPYLTNFDFKNVFGKLYAIKVDNDARSFLRASASGKSKKSSIAFTIGTGIGRAYSDKNKIRMIKQFEYPEKWEREYQKIRDFRTTEELAKYLGDKLPTIIKNYNPEQIIIGGGVVMGRKKKFLPLFKKRLKINGISLPMKTAIKKAYAGAFGSTLIFNKR